MTPPLRHQWHHQCLHCFPNDSTNDPLFPQWLHCGLNAPPMTPLWPQCTTDDSTVATLINGLWHHCGRKWPNGGKWGPGPVPRCTTRIRTVSTTHYPRAHHHWHHHCRVRTAPMYTRVSEVRDGSPGFFRLRVPDQNTELSKTTTLLTTFLTRLWTCQNWRFCHFWP